MGLRVKRTYLALGAAAVALAIPVLAQGGPESLLPPGFDDQPSQAPAKPQPAQAQPTTPAATPAVAGSTPIDQASAQQTSAAIANAAGALELADGEADNAAEDIAQKYDLPPTARRSLDVIGPLTPALGGLERSAFGAGHGQALARVMQATRVPIVSRWASIMLRRALLSQADTPSDIGGADWTAERAWLLLRMGEADNARLLVQAVDSDQYTKRLYSVAMQTQLAAADPAGFCTLLPRARDFTDEPGWFMAQAICASFSADQGTATALLSQAQRRGTARGVDYRLAEKVVGAGPNCRRSVKIEWEGAARLTTWRFGLATATNVEIPAALFATAGQQVRAWQARAPGLTLAARLPGVATATRLGVFSGAVALGYYSALSDQQDDASAAFTQGPMLREAYAGESIRDRISGMREFWSGDLGDGWTAGPDGVYYGALPVLARAAAAIPPTGGAGEDTPWLIAAMLSGGYDVNAARWVGALDAIDGSAKERSWALLATGLPQPRMDLSTSRIRSFLSADESEDQMLGRSLVAALAGLGRLPTADRAELLKDAGIDPTPRRRWARAVMASARRHERGTVAVLAAVGMQGAQWRAMSPEQLYFVVASLRESGLEPYARMIAAEAMARL